MTTSPNKDDLQRQTSGSNYKIFRLGPQGPEEMDFVAWASDLNRNHPIAKQYQAQRKSYFDKVRKDIAQQQLKQQKLNQDLSTSQNLNSPLKSLSPTNSRGKSDSITPQSRQISRNDFSPLIKLNATFSQNAAINPQTSLKKKFSLKLESTMAETSPMTSTSAYHGYNTQTTFKTNLLNKSSIGNLVIPEHTPMTFQSNYNSMKRFCSTSQNKSINKQHISENPISNTFDISQSKMVSQVRKHLNLVSHYNKYENNYLDQKEAAEFKTQNPLNVYYQITQNPDYCFNTNDILQPARRIDVQKLRENYKLSCDNDSRAARFEKSDFMPLRQPMTSYQGKRRKIELEKQSRCLSMLSNYQDELEKQQKLDRKDNQSMLVDNKKSQESLRSKTTLQVNDSVVSFKPKPSQSTISKRQNINDSTVSLSVKSKLTNISKSKSRILQNKNSNTLQQKHNQSINDITTEEPEFPLTGYNYRRYFNEGSLLMNATMSAHKIKSMLDNMDKQIIDKRQEMHRFKYDILINNKKQILRNKIQINHEQGKKSLIENIRMRMKTPDIKTSFQNQ